MRNYNALTFDSYYNPRASDHTFGLMRALADDLVQSLGATLIRINLDRL